MTDAASLGDALGKASQDLDDLLLRARQRFQENEGQFASEGIGILCGGLEIYGALFKQSGYEDRESLENAIGQQCLEVTKAAEKLLDVEADWSDFLRSVEAKEFTERDYVMPNTGDIINKEISFTCVPAGGESSGNCTSLSVAQDDEKARTSNYKVINLKDILSSFGQTSTLLVLNRHFA
ncbi:uncharacterized protein LOC135199463 isoform X1 [Macrobrachium nipponense]|uniref:uncharacterized protein LOC135199463 isoform X1 n=1 Tax=Macrobrachium nipponense TaxID=159736 RepID=UPI0030C8882C